MDHVILESSEVIYIVLGYYALYCRFILFDKIKYMNYNPFLMQNVCEILNIFKRKSLICIREVCSLACEIHL